MMRVEERFKRENAQTINIGFEVYSEMKVPIPITGRETKLVIE